VCAYIYSWCLLAASSFVLLGASDGRGFLQHPPLSDVWAELRWV
jgi:hypothetical protein